MNFDDLPKYVINLSKRTDRWQEFTRDAQILGLTNYKRFNGYEVDKAPEGWRRGKYGCYLSHSALWKVCLDLGEPIVIFEDDAIPTRRVFIPDIPEQVDFLYLGANDNSHGTEKGEIVAEYKEPTNKIAYLKRAKKIFANHAYICFPSGAEKALKLKARYATDLTLWGVFSEGHTYYISPSIFKQRPSFSDNEGKFCNHFNIT